MAIVDRLRKFLRFYKALIFITGVIFSYSLVEFAVVFDLMTYLTNIWDISLTNAAAIVNFFDGLSPLMAMALIYIADAYLNHFTVVLFSIPTLIIGLMLLYLSNLQNGRDYPLLYVGLFFIALGKASRDPSLRAFFGDQFKAKDVTDENRVQTRKGEETDKNPLKTLIKLWWNFASILGVIVAMLWLYRVSWSWTFKYSAIVHGVAYFLLLCGIPSYNRIKPSGSPLTAVFRVLVAATLKRRLDYPPPTELYEKNDQGINGRLLLPHTSRLRWLDKAAIKESFPHSSPEEHEKKWRVCTVTEVEETKLFVRMFPMWSTFIVYSLVESTGTTFFIEQGTNLKDSIGEKTKLPVSILYLFKGISKYVISYLYDQLLLSKRLTGSQKRYAIKARIGLGMLSSMFCCCTAWRVESRRLNVVNKNDLVDKPDDPIPMNIFWLLPQFLLLGTMKGLAEDGLRDFFFYDQVPESMWRYGPAFNDIVIGIGNLLSSLTVKLSGRWFADTLNKSRLDKYYLTLMVLSCINLGFYCCIATTFNREQIDQLEKNKPAAAKEEIDLKEIHQIVNMKHDERSQKGKDIEAAAT